MPDSYFLECIDYLGDIVFKSGKRILSNYYLCTVWNYMFCSRSAAG